MRTLGWRTTMSLLYVNDSCFPIEISSQTVSVSSLSKFDLFFLDIFLSRNELLKLNGSENPTTSRLEIIDWSQLPLNIYFCFVPSIASSASITQRKYRSVKHPIGGNIQWIERFLWARFPKTRTRDSIEFPTLLISIEEKVND